MVSNNRKSGKRKEEACTVQCGSVNCMYEIPACDETDGDIERKQRTI